MFKDLPPKIQKALETLWDYADDACALGRTKQECEDDGFECKGESAHYITFVIPRKEVNETEETKTL